MIRVLDLFSGIGGFSLGLHRAGGFETKAFVEIGEFQRKVLKKNFPSVLQIEDIRSVSSFDCDMVCGGFPCQPFSHAARGRNNAVDFWPEMDRVIGLTKPKYVAAENVQEKPIRKAEDDLRRRGYNVTVKNISAHDCGAPHGRSRWWLVAHPHDESEFLCAFDAETSLLPELCASVWNAEAYSKAIRVPDGISRGMDEARRLALGNTLLPAIPEAIGRAINMMRMG